MDNVIMVGCDLHEATLHLKVAVGNGKARTLRVRNTGPARRAMIRALLKLSAQHAGAPVYFAYEACGQGFWLHDELTAAGIRCLVLAPTEMPRSRADRSQKNDERDAQRILDVLRAALLAGSRLPSVWVPDQQTRDDRELVRLRLETAIKSSKVKTQIRMMLKRLNRQRGGDWGAKHLAVLKSLAASLPFGARTALSSLLRQLQALQDELAELDRAVAELAASARYREAVEQLRQRGVGVLTILTVLVEIGDPGRFANRRQLGAYFGLVPSMHESGQQSDCKGHITRRGPAPVRRVLCQAVWAKLRVDAKLGKAYLRWSERNPHRKKVFLVAQMRRLLIVLWHRAQELAPMAPPTLQSALLADPLPRKTERAAPARPAERGG
jgi:transposase